MCIRDRWKAGRCAFPTPESNRPPARCSSSSGPCPSACSITDDAMRLATRPRDNHSQAWAGAALISHRVLSDPPDVPGIGRGPAHLPSRRPPARPQLGTGCGQP
eukprot:15483232-Alexandrium_andersonii.AAC.1